MSQVRSKRLVVHLTQPEWDAVCLHAEHAGLPVSAWVRLAMLGEVGRDGRAGREVPSRRRKVVDV